MEYKGFFSFSSELLSIFFENAKLLKTEKTFWFSRQTSALIGRSGPGRVVCEKSEHASTVALLRGDPQFDHFTLTCLIYDHFQDQSAVN